MKKAATILCAVGIASAANAQTLDDLSIGTLTAGDTVMGDTSTSTDDMDFDSIGGGDGSGFGWSGGDDVYTLDWNGGDLQADLFFTNADGDIDLVLFDDPMPVDNALADSITTTDNEQIIVSGLAAGTYWFSVDGFGTATNTYTLSVVPAPSGMALLGLGGLIAGRRRR